MKSIKVSGGLILVPHSDVEKLVLYLLGKFIGEYSKTCLQDSYPLKRRWKIEFTQSL